MKMSTCCLVAAAVLAAPAASRGATLKLDPAHSRIEVAVAATAHSFTGWLEKFTATISGDPKSALPAAVAIAWDFADLKTGEGDRDSEMLGWLGHRTLPAGGFRMTKAWTDDAGRTWLQGDLKIHGVSKRIAFPYTARLDGKRMTLDGEVWIDHRDFELPLIRKLGVMKVDPKLKVHFHLEGDV